MTVEGWDGPCVIIGNGHTHAGRFLVVSSGDGQVFSASKYQIIDASDSAWAWIDGFLSGSEPSLEAYLGIEWLAAMDLDDADPGVIRWRKVLVFYHANGRLPTDQELE